MKNNRIKKVESKEAVERYETLKSIGKNIFSESHVVKTGEVNRNDVELAKKYLKEAITATDPETRATYFEHLMIAPELGKRIAESLPGVNPNEAEFFLWLHDLGRLASPGAFYRNDLITERLLYEFGIREDLRKKLPPLRDVEEAADSLDMTDDQIKGKLPFNQEQVKQVEDYFSSLTPTQIIINLADNLGKRDDKGGLFNLQSFHKYVQTYDARSKQDDKNNISWPSVDWAVEHRPEAARLQAFVVEKAIDWLKKQGVDIDKILAGLTDYGPKFVAIVRHGELHNPKGIIYNRDVNTKPEDIMHISEKGKKQLHAAGEVMKERIFRVGNVYASPETRAQESADALIKVMSLSSKPLACEALDDVYAPGAYAERLTMTQWEKLKGDAYDDKRWDKYHHEKPEAVTSRMVDFFWQTAGQLKVGQTGVLISHGDPIAFLINYLVDGKIPPPISLRDHIYPRKGQATIFIIDSQGKIFSHYFLKGPELIQGTIY